MAVPSIANTLLAHWDASVLALADGASVTSWPAVTGGGTLTPIGGATPPEYDTDALNGMGGVKFVLNDHLGNGAMPSMTQITVFAVIKNPPNDGTIKYILYSNGYLTFAKWSNVNRWVQGRSEFSFIEFTDAALVGQPCLWTLKHAGTGSVGRADQVQRVTGNYAGATHNALYLGPENNSLRSDFTMFELLIYSGIASAGDTDIIEDYLYNKWFVIPVPDQPTGLVATAIDGFTIQLDWDDNSDESSYRIERSDDGVSGWATVGTRAANITTFFEDTLTPETEYFYRLFAVNPTGDSIPSAVVSATTLEGPPDPVSLTSPSHTDTTVTLAWGDVATEDGYIVMRSEAGSFVDASGELPADTVGFVVTGLEPETEYQFYVISFSDMGSTDSEIITVTTGVPAPVPPPQVTGVTAVALSSSAIEIEWDDVAGETGYRVERSLDGVTDWVRASPNLPANTTFRVDRGRQYLTEYFYRVVAFNAGGDGPPSEVVSATTLAMPIPAPVSGTWIEVWSRPGAEDYGRKIADVPFLDASVTVAYNGVGKGNMNLPVNYTRLDDILAIRESAPATSVWSTVKVVDDNGVLYEWLPIPKIPIGVGKSDTKVELSGDGLEAMWGFARVEPWDWDGSLDWVPKFGDWIWGGKNLLQNPDFEDNDIRVEINEITHNASQGTFTLSDGVNTTPPIAFDQSDTSLENIIETYLTEIDDVLVTADVSEWTHMISVPDEPDVEGATIVTRVYHIEFVNPPIFPGGLIFNDGSLANPDLPIAIPDDQSAPGLEPGEDVVFIAELKRTQYGAVQPGGWTKSQTVSRGVPRTFGLYDSFKIVESPAESPTHSLRIDPGEVTHPQHRYAGVQQVVNVEPGGIYQAVAWVWPTSPTDTFRLVIRGIDEDFLVSDPPNLTSTTLTVGEWNELRIVDVNVGDNTQIIFRVANTNPPDYNPSQFFVDSCEFNEGRMPTTVGCMLEELYADATADHAPDRIVWNDESDDSIGPYLTLDFDCEVDSHGQPWDRDDVSQTFHPRMSYIQVIDQIAEEGYEWRVVPDVPTGRYLLQVYNPQTLGTSRPAGIVAGSTDVARSAQEFAPAATNVMVEGAEGNSFRVTHAGLLAAFGRIEGALLDEELNTPQTISQAAAAALREHLHGAESLEYTLSDPNQRPLALYRPGDRIMVRDRPLVDGQRRVASIQLSMTKEQPDQFVVIMSDANPFHNVNGVVTQRGLTGQAATDNAVTALLKAFRQSSPRLSPMAANAGGGGGQPTVVIAARDASELSKTKADLLCETETNDNLILEQAYGFLSPYAGGKIVLSEGTFFFDQKQVIPPNVAIEGMGAGLTAIRVPDWDVQWVISRGAIRHLSFAIGCGT